MLLLVGLLAQTLSPSPTSTGGKSGASGITTLLPLILIFALFYVFLIRPQRNRQRQAQALIGQLQVGDEVQTAAGMFGTISRLDDQFAWVELAPGLEIKMLRRAVVGRVGPEREPETPPEP
jgi:preprotein translocase subunit YajC